MNLLLHSDSLITQPMDSPKSSQSKTHCEVIFKLEHSRFPTFLFHSPETASHYAVKLFPLGNVRSSHSFKNESRFLRLSHPNLVSYVNYNERIEVKCDSDEIVGSYILMDASLYGSLADLLKLTDLLQDEILLRTYFHQLIFGLEYLHKNNIAHMDLKLSDLLIGEDFRLKITNLEEAFIYGDACISRGTKDYRAPEVAREKCRDPQSADIYSAGLILFTLKYGHLPYFENLDSKGGFVEHPMLEKYRKETQNTEELELLDLFFLMTNPDAVLRGTLKEIKSHKWFNRPIYSEKKIQFNLNMYFNENKPFYSSTKGSTTICLD